VGEQVVLLSLGGNFETAFALHAIYSDAIPPPDYSEHGITTVFKDGGWFQYEPATGYLLIKNIKSVLKKASDKIELNTAHFVVNAELARLNCPTVITCEAAINGSMAINGDVTQGGDDMSSNGVITDKHLPNKVKSGGDMSRGPQ